MYRFRLILCLALAATGGAALAQAGHELTVTLAPATGELSGRDRITIAGPQPAVHFRLARQLQVQGVWSDGRPVPFARRGAILAVQPPAGATSLEVQYAGHLGSEPGAQVTPQATWLGGESGWFPQQSEEDTLQVSVVTPAGQRAVVTGALLDEQVGASEVRATFRAYPGQSPTLFAGPYVVSERFHRGLRLRTYFPAGDQALASAYLDDVARHIDTFAAVIGPYPYQGFAVVAAEDGVGFGYPGLTYVSRRILALPFMRAQSLAHEILHDWWGNSVGVAPDSGNWAEALTTYMADYRLSAPPDRERMRREWLRDYAAMPAAQDQPLTAFKSRVHARDQVVGYGKGSLVFHMLERLIGTDAFDRGVAAYYQAFRGKSAGWAQLQEAFERTSGRSLDAFFRQWLDRAGAPSLALRDVHFGSSAVTLTVAQTAPAYELQVPIVVRTDSGIETHVVPIAGESTQVEVRTAGRPLELRVDPDQHVFRHLAAGEATPVMHDVTIRPGVQVVPVNVTDEARGPVAELAAALLQTPGATVAAAARDRAAPAAVFAIGTPADTARALGWPAPQLPPQDGTAWVWTQASGGVPTLVVCAQDAQAMQALIRPLPHYGREGWLVFRGAQLVARGNWPTPPDNAFSARR